MPFPFYLSGLALLCLGFFAFKARWKGWGLPMGMVLATVGAWYFDDAIYNDYDGYRSIFGEEILSEAWWQVLLFLGAFSVLTPTLHIEVKCFQ